MTPAASTAISETTFGRKPDKWLLQPTTNSLNRYTYREKERGLPEDYLIEKIKAAIVIAVKKDYEVEDDNVIVDIDPAAGAFRASLAQDIVEEVENPTPRSAWRTPAACARPTRSASV